MEKITLTRTPDEVREYIADLIRKVEFNDTTGLRKKDIQRLYGMINDDTTSDELSAILLQANLTANGN